MPATQLIRKSDGKVMANRQTVNWEGWTLEYMQPRLRTTAGVSLLQEVSVGEFVTETNWRFDSRHPVMTVGLMWDLVIACKHLTVFRFYDLEGGQYDVQAFAMAQPKRDTRIFTYSQYELKLFLLRLGFVP